MGKKSGEKRRPILRDEGMLIRFLTRLCDLIILNLVWIVCCLPIVTIGAATSALYYTMMKMHGQEEGGILRTYFHGFRINVAQATRLWLMVVVAAVVIGVDLWFGYQNITTATGLLVLIAGVVLALLLLCECVWLFPLQARFQNTDIGHLKNAMALFRLYIPHSLLVLLIWALPLALSIAATEIQYIAFWLWLTCGFASLFYLCAYFFRNDFDKLQV